VDGPCLVRRSSGRPKLLLPPVIGMTPQLAVLCHRLFLKIIQGLQSLCKVNWDPRRLPQTAISKKYNPLGKPYYRVDFHLVIHFLTTLEFKIYVGGRIDRKRLWEIMSSS
jgi:hypothetical protein